MEIKEFTPVTECGRCCPLGFPFLVEIEDLHDHVDEVLKAEPVGSCREGELRTRRRRARSGFRVSRCPCTR